MRVLIVDDNATSREILQGMIEGKVMMVTACGREEVRRRAQAAALDGFLMKPVTQSILFDSTMAAFGKKSERRPTGPTKAVRFQDLEGIRGAKVLLVENNEINQQVAQEILQQGGLVVDLANDGQEAVAAVNRNRYDAVLMDIQMPVMDGHEAARKIREGEAPGESPCLSSP